MLRPRVKDEPGEQEEDKGRDEEQKREVGHGTWGISAIPVSKPNPLVPASANAPRP